MPVRKKTQKRRTLSRFKRGAKVKRKKTLKRRSLSRFKRRAVIKRKTMRKNKRAKKPRQSRTRRSRLSGGEPDPDEDPLLPPPPAEPTPAAAADTLDPPDNWSSDTMIASETPTGPYADNVNAILEDNKNDKKEGYKKAREYIRDNLTSFKIFSEVVQSGNTYNLFEPAADRTEATHPADKVNQDMFSFFKTMQSKDKGHKLDQTIIKNVEKRDKYVILRNRREAGGFPGGQTPSEEGDSMSFNHQFIATRDKKWSLFNAITFGLVDENADGNVSDLKQRELKDTIEMLKDFETIAKSWAAKRGVDEENLEMLFHIWPTNSVYSLHLHIIDNNPDNLNRVSYNKNGMKKVGSVSLKDVLDVLQEELQEELEAELKISITNS